MDFTLTADERAIKEAARAFARHEMAPNAKTWDEAETFPIDTLRHAAALGFAGIYVRDDVGGSDLSRFDAALIFEELAQGCVSTAAFLSIHNMASWMIDAFGSDELRQRYLPSLCTMDKVASYCLTEPGAGRMRPRCAPALAATATTGCSTATRRSSPAAGCRTSMW